MMTVDQIVERFGGPSAFARAIGKHPKHGVMMKLRNSIPARYWALVVEAATKQGHDQITLEVLALAHAAPPSPPSLSQGDAA